jgi:tRNA A-37 threonylcarbamoyl transferase component Bud32
VELAKYEIIKRLAAGGMAEIFLARASGLPGVQKTVVIKRILPVLASKSDFLEMFLNEARIAATLQHVNVVQMYDVGVADGNYFIVMEYLHGEDVRSIQRALYERRERLPLEHALHIAIGVCAGLHYAHEKIGHDGQPLNIVHRDVSPQNVIVTYNGDVKLLDFGVAKASSNLHETACGIVKGKIPYMSPEHCMGHTIDRRADIFSLGIMMFELTLGRRLYGGGTEFETLKRIVEQPVPRPSELEPDYDLRLEQIVMRALAKRADDRYATARELQIELEDLARERRMYMSAIALSQFMERLFGNKIEAWRETGQPPAREGAREADGGDYELEIVAEGPAIPEPPPPGAAPAAGAAVAGVAPAAAGPAPAAAPARTLTPAGARAPSVAPPRANPRPVAPAAAASAHPRSPTAAPASQLTPARAVAPLPASQVTPARSLLPPAAPAPQVAPAGSVSPPAAPASQATPARALAPPPASASSGTPVSAAAPAAGDAAMEPAQAPTPELAPAHEPTPAREPTPTDWPPALAAPPARRRARTIAGAAAALLLATVAGAVVARRAPSRATVAPRSAVAPQPTEPPRAADPPRPELARTEPAPPAEAARAVAAPPRAAPLAARATVPVADREPATRTPRSRHARGKIAAALRSELPRAASPPARDPAVLVLDTTPWCEVEIDGVPRGSTPLSAPLPAGAHRVRLTNADYHIDQVVPIVLAPNQKLRKRITFPTVIARRW